MDISFGLGGVHGEISAKPDRFHLIAPNEGGDGLVFASYAFASAGHGTQTVQGLQIGCCRVEPGTVLRFSDDGLEASVTDAAVVQRVPGRIGRTVWNGPYRACFLALTPEALERITGAPFARMRAVPFVCPLPERQRICHLLAALDVDREEPGPDDPLFLESIAVAVIRASGALPGEPWRRTPTLSSEQAKQVRLTVAARIAQPLGLRDLAAAAGLSESYFVRAFKGSFGMTPYQYVLRERVSLADALIRSGAVPLSEAAARSGFPDVRRMGRTFRLVTGRSPTGPSRRRGG